MNSDWVKQTATTMTDTVELHEYRISQLEKRFGDITSKIEKIEEICNRLDKKLTGIPDGGLQCPLHQMRMEQFDKRITTIEVGHEGIQKKIITWTAICGVILFLLSQVVIPYGLNHIKLVSTDKPAITSVDIQSRFNTNTSNAFH